MHEIQSISMHNFFHCQLYIYIHINNTRNTMLINNVYKVNVYNHEIHVQWVLVSLILLYIISFIYLNFIKINMFIKNVYTCNSAHYILSPG